MYLLLQIYVINVIKETGEHGNVWGDCFDEIKGGKNLINSISNKNSKKSK